MVPDTIKFSLKNELGERIELQKSYIFTNMRISKLSQVRFVQSLDNTEIEDWDASGVHIAVSTHYQSTTKVNGVVVQSAGYGTNRRDVGCSIRKFSSASALH